LLLRSSLRHSERLRKRISDGYGIRARIRIGSGEQTAHEGKEREWEERGIGVAGRHGWERLDGGGLTGGAGRTVFDGMKDVRKAGACS